MGVIIRHAPLVLALLALACGPRAALQVAADHTATPTPVCAPMPVAAVMTPHAEVVVTAVATVRAVAVATASLSAGPKATPVPRDQLVRAAVATATAQAIRPPTATPIGGRPAAPPPGSPPVRPDGPPAGGQSVAASQAAPNSLLVERSTCPTPIASPAGGLRLVPVTPRLAARAVAPASTPTRAGAPSAPPSPRPGPTLVAPDVLLASDTNSVVQLKVGERFVLLLGDYAGGTDWQVQVADPQILQHVGNEGQGVYQASSRGQTQLTVIGGPACLNARPPCAVPSRLLRFTIVVT